MSPEAEAKGLRVVLGLVGEELGLAPGADPADVFERAKRRRTAVEVLESDLVSAGERLEEALTELADLRAACADREGLIGRLKADLTDLTDQRDALGREVVLLRQEVSRALHADTASVERAKGWAQAVFGGGR